MKYLKKFNNHSNYEEFIVSGEYIEPHVSSCLNNNEIHYNLPPLLTFVAEEANSTISFNRIGTATTLENASLQYSIDNGLSFNEYELGSTITLEKVGDSVKFKGTNEVMSNGNSNYHKFVMTGKISAKGDITSLFNEYGGDMEMPLGGCFHMFSYCTSLTTAPNLPSTKLGDECYAFMFKGCTLLNNPPKLPSKKLGQYCYYSMFDGCTSITETPELPATELYQRCYEQMFQYCTSLVTVPDLPSLSLPYGCYTRMFKGCTSLTTVQSILPATTLGGYCYQSMFEGCTGITIAPVLPAITLKDHCYYYMFNGCTSLNYIKALFTTTPSSTITGNWVNGVAQTGTFVKNAAATWNVNGANGIPNGWTVQTDSP